MNRPGAMSRHKRPTIKWMETKEARREERRKIGKLSELRVSPTTLLRYEESLLELCRYSRCTREALLSDGEFAGQAVKAYIEFLWEDGSLEPEPAML